MIRVATSSRLHFGLFRLPTADAGPWPDLEGNLSIPARHFGGVGLMIDKPGVQISATPARTWSARGPCAERALSYAQEFLRQSPDLAPQPFHLAVERCAPEHVGLGTGTQLGLAVATALASALGGPVGDVGLLASRVGRGQRSALGVHGFQQGGFLVDGGKSTATTVAPLIARHAFPTDWAVLLVIPKDSQGVHGPREQEAFAQLAKTTASDRQTDALCRLVMLGILPALVEHDLPAFGEALYDFNRRVGEMFKPWQAGIYANSKTAALVDFFRKNGVRAVGQSSWGPAVFAIASKERANDLADRLRAGLGGAEYDVFACRGVNQGFVFGFGLDAAH